MRLCLPPAALNLHHPTICTIPTPVLAGISTTVLGSHMLRARSKTGEPIDSCPAILSSSPGKVPPVDELNGRLRSPKLGQGTRRHACAAVLRARSLKTKLCVCFFFVVALGMIFAALSAYMRVDPPLEPIPRSNVTPGKEEIHQRAVNDSDSGLLRTYSTPEADVDTPMDPIDNPPATKAVPRVDPAGAVNKKPFKYTLVDRSILAKLDRLEHFFADDYGLSPPSPVPQRQGPPLITRIPEPRRIPHPPKRGGGGGGGSSGRDSLNSANANAICESLAHPRPCRFLLPLRIAEQESKARIHLSQVAQLARQLNRTLVLPNVGKSKIGACFKWPFATYYDPSSLLADDADDQGPEAFVELEAFRSWWDAREKHGRSPVNSQLISVAPALPAHGSFRNEFLYANDDVQVHAYNVFGAWNHDLPGCVGNKFRPLGPALPVFMSANAVTTREGVIRPIGDHLLDAFTTVLRRRLRRAGLDFLEQHAINDIRGAEAEAPEPDVVVVNWDLRYPVFPSTSGVQSLQYSTHMHELAERHSPKDPYLVIHWRMETVDPEVLQECAHALVDVLIRMLHDQTLAENVTTVWFASDYPYPIARRTAMNKRPAVAAKSGTFRDFEIGHEEAVEVLRNAFDQGGELNGWKLTDFAESMERTGNADHDLLVDPGVLGILDKIVSMKANLFVSGSTQCARKSSFTKQVVDGRRYEWSKSRQSHLRNIVDVFG